MEKGASQSHFQNSLAVLYLHIKNSQVYVPGNSQVYP